MTSPRSPNILEKPKAKVFFDKNKLTLERHFVLVKDLLLNHYSGENHGFVDHVNPLQYRFNDRRTGGYIIIRGHKDYSVVRYRDFDGLNNHKTFPEIRHESDLDELKTFLEENDIPNFDKFPGNQLNRNALYEGSIKSVLLNKYERNKEARTTCLKRYGFNCWVCSFNFEKKYGHLGKGFIHVHHLIPISSCKEEYQINPIEDLKPVCPNCHAMLHKKDPPYSIEELSELVNKHYRSDS